MSNSWFQQRLETITGRHEELLSRKNEPEESTRGWFRRYRYPVITAEHTPLYWRYDLDPETNPHLMERLGINSAFNPGAIEIDGTICLVVRVEGMDRKSFFAVAESENGVDNFRFRDYPIVMPETDRPDVNIYDMRLTRHEDGWIYGVFCTERKDPEAEPHETAAAEAQAGIARTTDLREWERLDNLRTPSPQQRNVVLHPEFVEGKYAFYTRPQEGFIRTGSGGGIGWGLVQDIEHAVIDDEIIVDEKKYHTIKEAKNGLGPAPIKTEHGWLQMAHGVRDTAAGLRYVNYLFMTELEQPWKVIYEPGGYFLAPRGDERIGDVSNVVFNNAWVRRNDGTVYIYYGSSDTRTHVATTSLEQLVDYARNTPEDRGKTGACVDQRNTLIRKNLRRIQHR